ncbi:MAG: hypothetical protein Q8933_17500 [Bacteroidota bacterium]|nr:hypothetical protein [Bacteroidota bacterium]MDP4191053.1 hypothetical protein [Bacteroidota bacterium]MDP4195947.1 hypothetical protein [Bacteroidota bacterium]
MKNLFHITQRKYPLSISMPIFPLIIFAFTFLSISILISGCQKKQQQTANQNSAQQKDSIAANTTDTTKNKLNANLQDLKGTWSGKMGAFKTTLKITDQTQNDFKGSITVAFRDPLNQQISGKFDPATGKLTMHDVLKQRYQGKYNAKVSAKDKLSGTYSLNDGQKFNFNLSKK